MTYKLLAIASIAGLAVSPALPSEAWAPVISAGACAVILFWTLLKTIPDKEKHHTAQINKICETHRAVGKDIKDEIKSGNDRVAVLLQSTLSEMSRER